MLRIEKYENDVYKLVCLVQDECTGLKLEDIIKGIKQSVEEFHNSNEERRKRFLSWINGIDTKNTYETALQYRHQGTCQWVLQLPEFLAWDATDSPDARVLWLHGPAGFGKTFMSAWIIQHLEQKKQAPLSYFFCVADNQLTRDPYAALRSWLTQLLEQDELVLSSMDTVYQARNKEQTLTQLGLWELFIAVGNAIEGCTFVVDGFDECTDIDTGAHYHHNEPRNLFLRDMLKYLPETKSRVLVVSRDVPDIREYLGRESLDTPGLNVLEYEISAKDTTADVRSFSEFMVNKKLSQKKSGLRQEIASEAARRSEGMFLWINLLEREITPGQNAKELRNTVREMPSGIGEAYSREIEKIARLPRSQKSKAVMILRWTLFAIRPLRVKELAEALVVSDDDLDEYPEDDLPDSWEDGFVDEDYVKEMILGKCGSLLQLRSNSAEVPLADHTVHFVHFSVKEYLSNLPNTGSPNQWAAEFGLAQALDEEILLSRICLRYLTLSVFEDIPKDTSIYPFLSYASWAWYFHSFHKKPAPSQDIMHRTRKAFDPATSGWKVWTPLMESELALIGTENRDSSPSSTNETDSKVTSNSDVSSEVTAATDTEPNANLESRDEGRCKNVLNPIYYASLLGLTDVVKWLVAKGLDCGCEGGRFGFPLQAAVARNNKEVVEHLLDRKVNASQKGGEFGASIIAAAAISTPDMVEVLLAAKADVTAVGQAGYTALHHAARRGSAEITRQLLDHGADVDSMGHTHWTAASVACRFGHRDVLSVLLSYGTKLDLVGNIWPPFQMAILNGHEDLVSILLDKGCQPNTLFPNGFGPLHCAVRSLKITEILLEKGADPNLAASTKTTPLRLAAANGDIKVMVALINAGARVSDNSGSDAEICTPLQYAVGNGHLPAAKLLYEHGAYLDSTLKGNLNALLLAVGENSYAIVEWLLDVGASIQGIFEHTQQSLIDIATDNGHLEVAKLLVKRGCFNAQKRKDVDKTQESPDPPQVCDGDSLATLAYSGDIEGVKSYLLDLGGSYPAYVLNEGLYAASAQGHFPVAELLLRKGARVNMQDINGRTALHYAMRYIHEDIVELLVEKGASISIEDNIGSTSIDLAIIHGEKAISIIQNYMDNLTFNISRRPSLLAVTPNPNSNLSVVRARTAISGSWTGQYNYLAWRENVQEPFSINIPSEAPIGSRPCTFRSKKEDEVGKFQIHGFVDPIGTVWFVKLYESHGWLYKGQVDLEKKTLKGTWGTNRKLWFGTFVLEQEE